MFNQAKMGHSGKFLAFGLVLAALLSFAAETTFGQKKARRVVKQEPTRTVQKGTSARQVEYSNLPKVTQIDLVALQNLLRREAAEGESPRPLLINFWATWCDPCREEFPDLVKIDADYKGKIDFITISLDELSEINRDVPKFLAQMKAEMPAYLLKTPDEEAAISAVSKDWQGGLPFTILFNGKGETVFTRQGIIKPAVLRTELDKTIAPPVVPAAAQTVPASGSRPAVDQDIILPLRHDVFTYSYEKGVGEAKRDAAAGRLVIKRYGLTAAISPAELKRLKNKYGIEITEAGCLVMPGFVEYARGYNEVMTAEIGRRFGTKILGELAVK